MLNQQACDNFFFYLFINFLVEVPAQTYLLDITYNYNLFFMYVIIKNSNSEDGSLTVTLKKSSRGLSHFLSRPKLI